MSVSDGAGATSVNVTVAGRSFRMACGPGEEDHLITLAALVDQRITDLRAAFGEIGDQRLTVMAAITIADELAESRRRTAELEATVATLSQSTLKAEDNAAAWVESLAQTLDVTARRIEGIAQAVGGAKG